MNENVDVDADNHRTAADDAAAATFGERRGRDDERARDHLEFATTKVAAWLHFAHISSPAVQIDDRALPFFLVRLVGFLCPF